MRNEILKYSSTDFSVFGVLYDGEQKVDFVVYEFPGFPMKNQGSTSTKN